jgi:IS5 family transposase
MPYRHRARFGAADRSDKPHAGRVYDAEARRPECRAHGFVPRIARKGIESSQKRGRHRWLVDPSTSSGAGTQARFNRFRRLPIR